MKVYSERAAKVQQRIDEISLYSDDPRWLSRTFGSQAWKECGQKIASWMQESGLDLRIDNIGNLRGKLTSSNPEAKTFVIGSHFDTTVNAGKYDGVLGIIMGLDIIENIRERNISFPFHIEIIAFAEESGIRFHTGYLGSKVIAGAFKNKFLIVEDDRGNQLSQVLQSMNYDPSRLKEDAIPAEEWLGYFEIHIEQGPTLFERNIPVGIVNNIIGQKKIEINFTGETGHAGTVPMNLRRDALCAAAKFILGVEKFASKEKRKILATVGKLEVQGAASNTIAAIVNCTLDLRSEDAQLLSDAYEFIYSLCEKHCDKRNIYFEWKLLHETDPVACNKKFRKLLANSISEKNIEVIYLDSGAVHDAAIISQVAPVIMLFVKCAKGTERHPLENVADYDVATALDVCDHFLEQLSVAIEKSFKEKIKIEI
ncbi:MAG TPA: Zn-dependent hydrolase [Hanamia sp.]